MSFCGVKLASTSLYDTSYSHTKKQQCARTVQDQVTPRLHHLKTGSPRELCHARARFARPESPQPRVTPGVSHCSLGSPETRLLLPLCEWTARASALARRDVFCDLAHRIVLGRFPVKIGGRALWEAWEISNWISFVASSLLAR